MYSIIVDGYNLIGTGHGDLRGRRDSLIRALGEYRKLKGHEITVVFDGWKGGGNSEVLTGSSGIKVIYSRLGETADQVIKKTVSGQGRQWVVVTSDRDIAAYVWACGSVPVSSERFQSLLDAAGGTGPDGAYEPLDDDDAPAERKGNSRMPSRKERALKRVLKKL